MSSSADATADQAHEMMKDVADHWGLIVVLGVLSVILGLLAIAYPGATIVTISIFFAAWLFVSGIFYLISSFTRDGDTGSRVLSAIIGVLSIIVGWALLRTPFQSVEVFIFVIGILFLIQGVMTFIGAFARKAGRNWRHPQWAARHHRRDHRPDLADLVGCDPRPHRRDLAGHPRDHAGRRRHPAPKRREPSLGGAARRLRERIGRPAGPGRPPCYPVARRRPAPTTLSVAASPGTRRPSLRRSSVVERAAVNRLVVSSSPTAGASSCP